MKGKNRIDKLRERLRGKVDAILIVSNDDSPDMNLQYYTGLRALTSSGALFMKLNSEPILIVSDIEQASRQTGIKNLVERKRKEDLYNRIKEAGYPKRIGINAEYLSLASVRKLRGNLRKVRFVDISEHLKSIRAVKDKTELTSIKKACELSRKAIKIARDMVKDNKTEREIYSELVYFYYRNGSEPVPFHPLVASGPENSVYMHTGPTGRKIKDEDLVIVDTGCRVNGYCSDLTRTFCNNRGGEEKRVLNLVEKANRTAMERVRAGMTGDKAYKIAKKIFEMENMDRFWKYGLGHGVGLDIHEAPNLLPESKDELKTGMVFTIEPGLAIPGVGGARLEHTGVLTKGGFDVL
jgi:Xaa-Pro aminopeptidase